MPSRSEKRLSSTPSLLLKTYRWHSPRRHKPKIHTIAFHTYAVVTIPPSLWTSRSRVDTCTKDAIVAALWMRGEEYLDYLVWSSLLHIISDWNTCSRSNRQWVFGVWCGGYHCYTAVKEHPLLMQCSMVSGVRNVGVATLIRWLLSDLASLLLLEDP